MLYREDDIRRGKHSASKTKGASMVDIHQANMYFISLISILHNFCFRTKLGKTTCAWIVDENDKGTRLETAINEDESFYVQMRRKYEEGYAGQNVVYSAKTEDMELFVPSRDPATTAFIRIGDVNFSPLEAYDNPDVVEKIDSFVDRLGQNILEQDDAYLYSTRKKG